MYYNVIANYKGIGECLATLDNGQAIFRNREAAEKRLAEVKAQGYEARIEEQKIGSVWWDDNNWIG